MKTFFYKSFDKGFNLKIKINDTKFICLLYEDVKYINNKQPILKSFLCNKLINFNINDIILDITIYFNFII